MKPGSITAGDFLAAVADTGSFRSWVIPGEALDAGAEAVQIGEVRIRGRRVAVIISDFACQAGSLGRATANRIVGALRTAAALDLPVFASPASGGTRIDEGTLAFVKMIDIAAAARAHRESGQVMVVWLRHPTTGGTMATWASLGQITFGQSGATAGFLGPRLFEPLIGRSLPDGVQTTDNLARVGIIDGLLGLDDLKPMLDRILSVTTDSRGEEVAGSGESVAPAVNAEGLAGLLAASSEVTELFGTGGGERSAAVRVALARVAGQRCVIVGQDRLAQSGGDPLGPGALRFARRGIRLADELRLPLVTVIDTEGGELSAAAEEGALAGEIARCLADLVSVRVPTVSLVLGPGCGGAALALLPADRVLALPQSWVAPLPLAGASLIRHRDIGHAEQMGRIMRISAPELAAAGIVDEVIEPLVSDSTDLADADIAGSVVRRLAQHLADLVDLDSADRLRTRTDRYGGGLRAVPESVSGSS